MSGLSAPRRVALSLTLAAACWGVGTAISKRAVVEFPPLTLLPIQLAVSVAALLLVMRWRGERIRLGTEPALLGRLGLLNPGLAYALGLLGLVQITASLSVLLWAVEPLLILGLATLFLGERVGHPVIVLSAVAVAGMALVLDEPVGGGRWLGVLLTLAGVASCAVYTVVARRWLSTAGSTLGVVVVQQLYALVFSIAILAAVGFLGGPIRPVELTAAGATSVVLSGFVYYGLAYSFYLYGLRHVRASVAAVAFYLIPAFGIAAGSVLGERFDGRQWIGAALVVGAVSLVAWRTSTDANQAQAGSSAGTPMGSTMPGMSLRKRHRAIQSPIRTRARSPAGSRGSEPGRPPRSSEVRPSPITGAVWSRTRPCAQAEPPPTAPAVAYRNW